MEHASADEPRSLSTADVAADADQAPDFRAASTLRFADHLFISGDTNFINEQHTGQVVFPPDVKAGWWHIIQDRHARLAPHGEFVFVLAPDKQSVYRHILPSSFKYRQAAFLASNAHVIDPSAVLAAAAEQCDVYPRSDSHWNHFGALVVVNMIMARFKLKMPELRIRWVDQGRVGDLGLKLSPPESTPRLAAIFRSPVKLLYDNSIPNNGRIRIWSKPSRLIKGEPSKLMLVGDSFAYDLVHFLKEAFDIVVHVHAFAMDYRISDAFRPHFIVSEITERFLLRLPIPEDGEALTELWQDKLRRGERLEKQMADTSEDRNLYCSEVNAIIDYATDLFAPFASQMHVRD